MINDEFSFYLWDVLILNSKGFVCPNLISPFLSGSLLS